MKQFREFAATFIHEFKLKRQRRLFLWTDHPSPPPRGGARGGSCVKLDPCTGASLVSGQHHLSEPDEGVSLCGRPEQTDLPDGLSTVTLGQVVGLLHAVALEEH